jgi:hypothetical protein
MSELACDYSELECEYRVGDDRGHDNRGHVVPVFACCSSG